MKPEMVQEYAARLDRNDRDGAVKLVLGWLEQGKCGIAELYTEALLPGLQPDSCLLDQSEWCLWRDRIRNSITRTVVEACYPYVLKERDARAVDPHLIRELSGVDDSLAVKRAGSADASAGTRPRRAGAIVVCPRNETSDAAARIYSDFFVLAGARADFIGTDVPDLDIASAASFMKSRFVCVVADTPFTLTGLCELADLLKATQTFWPGIIVAGRAVEGNEEAIRKSGARPVKCLGDVEMLVEEEAGRPLMNSRAGDAKGRRQVAGEFATETPGGHP